MKRILLIIGLIFVLTSCGANKEFTADTHSLIKLTEVDISTNSFSSEDPIKLYMDKWGTVKFKNLSDEEKDVLSHVVKVYGYTQLYSGEKDETQRSVLRKSYLTEVELIKNIIK